MAKQKQAKDFGDELYALLVKYNLQQVDQFKFKLDLMQAIVQLIELLLTVELEIHLGYKKSKSNQNPDTNYRNGYSCKTVVSDFGKKKIKTPRDRNGTFVPRILVKHQKKINMIEAKLLSLYQIGISRDQIKQTLAEIYRFTLADKTINKMTDLISGVIRAFHVQKIDRIYAAVLLDNIVLKTSYQNDMQTLCVYILTGLKMNKQRQVLGYYVSQTINPPDWATIFANLQARGCRRILLLVTDNTGDIINALKTFYPRTKIKTTTECSS